MDHSSDDKKPPIDFNVSSDDLARHKKDLAEESKNYSKEFSPPKKTEKDKPIEIVENHV